MPIRMTTRIVTFFERVKIGECHFNANHKRQGGSLSPADDDEVNWSDGARAGYDERWEETGAARAAAADNRGPCSLRA